MTNEQHTKERWVVGNTDPLLFGVKRGNGTEPIGFVYGPSFAERSEYGQRALANARRICACVNALEGVPTEWLESFRLSDMSNVAQDLHRVTAQRDELLAALTTIYHSANGAHPTEFGLCVASIEGIARAAIAKAEAAK